MACSVSIEPLEVPAVDVEAVAVVELGTIVVDSLTGGSAVFEQEGHRHPGW